MDKFEAIRQFIRTNLKIILSKDPFPDDLYKKTKRQYFLVQQGNTVGIPRDAEIAEESLTYLLKTGQIKTREKLDEIFQMPFFRRHVRETQAHIQYLELNVLGKSTVPIDPSSMGKQEYRQSLEGQIRKKVVEEGTEEIEKKIEEKRREY